ncbi:FxSxx-COOH system tetratricopeptide repeat protein [Lipingzhangella sp. LS1_29]|uniref:FxSxx-COOH system tetratricopeptide repeat protein n=1 Tax=Lipingzhangella rawalii TaxID=2055835 RepID=A0ABU2H235_9ACTN|nr:FxSxx-COOH system tetratricopeptide repeat protein [Lipingzhangella rawalii]MDS1269369.1 FxSxx-COOH system tetratricopeptide repeat protein [Lipingzhangella rawalii]
MSRHEGWNSAPDPDRDHSAQLSWWELADALWLHHHQYPDATAPHRDEPTDPMVMSPSPLPSSMGAGDTADLPEDPHTGTVPGDQESPDATPPLHQGDDTATDPSGTAGAQQEFTNGEHLLAPPSGWPAESTHGPHRVPTPAATSPDAPPHQSLPWALGQFRSWQATAHSSLLDEAATAEGFAERTLALAGTSARAPLIPELRGGRERALRLTVLVDDTPTMVVHRQRVAEFVDLAVGLRVFRSVRVFRFDSDKGGQPPGTDLWLSPERSGRSAGAHTTGASKIAPQDLFGREGPTQGGTATGSGDTEVTLVLTDAVGLGWTTGVMEQWLAQWGRYCALALVQLLDRSQWPRTAMELYRVTLRRIRHLGRPAGVVGNDHTRAQPIHTAEALLPTDDAAAGDGDSHEDEIRRRQRTEDAIPVPVLELDPNQLYRWARFVIRGTAATSYHGPSLLARGKVDPAAALLGHGSVSTAGVSGSDTGQPTAAQRVARFRATAGPNAFELAVLLAAVPLSLDVMHVVQQRLLPSSGASDLSEVIAGDLVYQLAGTTPQQGPEEIWLDFHPGVRHQLLTVGGRRSETIAALDLACTQMSLRIPWLHRVHSALCAPRDRHELSTGVDRVPDSVVHAVLAAFQALSGPYRDAVADLAAVRGDTHPEFSDNAAESPPDNIGSTTVDGRAPDPHVDSGAAPTHSSPDTGADRPGHGVHSPSNAVREPVPAAAPAALPQAGPAELIGARVVDSSPAQVSTQPRRGPDYPPPVWGQIPPRNTSFVGRSDLLELLHERLQQGTTAVVPTSLQGMGGVGKTQLALEYVYRHRQDYDLVWWIPADSPAQIQQSLADLATRLRLPGSSEAATAVRSILEALRLGEPYDNWLLVYDNAGSPDSVHPFIPVDGPGQVLVTSRQAEWRRDRNSALEVNVFTRAESLELLRLRGPAGLGEQTADRIAERLGDLPLAVEQTAVWLTETLMDPEDWLRLFQEKSVELLNEAGSEHHSSVVATMNLSLDRLADTNPAALQLLRVCAFLAPQPVPRRLFYGARNVDVPSELHELLSDPIKLGRALRAADKYALVKLDHRNESFQLHQLVQLAVLQPMSQQERTAMRRAAHMLLANLNPGDPSSAADWPRYTELLPHVRATDMVDSDIAWARELVIGEIRFLGLWGAYNEGYELGQYTLTRWREQLGPEHRQTVRAALAHARILRYLGKFQDAYDLCTNSVNTLAETRGADDEETLDASRLLAWDLRNLGEFHRAVEVSADVLAKHTRQFGRDDPYTLQAAHVHALGLRLIGQFQEGMEISWYNFQRLQEMVGPEHESTNAARHQHGIALMESGRYAEAESELDQLVRDLNQLREPNAPGRLSVLASLSVAKRRTGQLERSRTLSEEAWSYSLDSIGPDAPDTMIIASCHAVALRVTQEHTAALELSEEVHRRLRALYGPHHPHYAGAAVNFAVVLRQHGRFDEAREVNEEARSILALRLGTDHHHTLACDVNRASDLRNSGDTREAIELGEDVARRCRELLTSDHPLTLAARRNLALDRQEIDADTTELSEVHRNYQAVFGPEHPATVATAEGRRANCDIFLTGL